MLRIGIIGCGGMAGYHLPFLQEIDGVEIPVCCDLLAEKAQYLAEIAGARACTDFREVFDDVDTVWVCTEPFNRVEIVTAAAEAGKDIFTEKPIGLTLEDADTMIAAARRANVIYMLGYCLRFWQPFSLMQDLFASGELGDLVTCWTRRFMPADFRGGWYGDQALSGGVGLDFGSHDLDWLAWIGGPVKTAFGHTSRIRDGVQADEYFQGMLRFTHGGVGHADVTWWDTISESSLGIVGTKGSLLANRAGVVSKKLIDGEETTIYSDSAMAVDPEGNVGRRDDSGEIHRVETKIESIQQHFVRCVRERLTPLTDAANGREVLRIVEALRESARTHQAVDLS